MTKSVMVSAFLAFEKPLYQTFMCVKINENWIERRYSWMNDFMKQLELEMLTLTVYRNLMRFPVMASFYKLCQAVSENNIHKALDGYAETSFFLNEQDYDDIGVYLFDQVKYMDTSFTKNLSNQTVDPTLNVGVIRDLKILAKIASLKCVDIKTELNRLSDNRYCDLINEIPVWKSDFHMSFDELKKFHLEYGAGMFAKYRAFIWAEGVITPITSPDKIKYDEMIGYKWQRETVLENTRALLNGAAVNNILLYGDSGTGKSATVKSMLNVPEFRDLRIIEVSKDWLTSIPELLRQLSWRKQKFILFIDDLSFEEGDKNYSAMKVILEGGIEQRPHNTALYVTSNRRQLVKRRFSDRDELDSSETVQEKTSLADRFGIRIPYLSMDRRDFLDISESLALRAGSVMDSESLRKAALRWEMEHGARTPRVACQFAEYVAAHKMEFK